jgi:hypothetical protein
MQTECTRDGCAGRGWSAIRVRLVAALAAYVVVDGIAGATARADGPIAICTKQRYALCATASCFVLNDVAYCKCDVKFGSSISEAFPYDGGNICTLNRAGYANGYMVSTYSLPPSVLVGGNKALYTCAGSTATGAYAQCDGGLCFTSTRGRSFPGFAGRLRPNEIICSCPITIPDPAQDPIGHQIVGPYPCQPEFFAHCTSTTPKPESGSTLYVGAPTGVPRILTERLYGSVPPLNYCFPPQ